MEKIDIVLWAVGGGFVITLGMLKVMWNEIKDIRKDLNTQGERLARIEGILSPRDHFIVKDENYMKKIS